MATSVLWLGRYEAAKFIALVFVFLCILFMGRAQRAFAATGSGTVISNTATINFSDANSYVFSATSNTITSVVQDAPSLTVTAPGTPQTVSPGMVVVDTFVLTNTGNASGSLVLPADATFAGSAAGTTLLGGYVLNGLAIGTCSVGTPCTMSILNAQSGMSTVAVNGTITVGVEYTAPIGAIDLQTVQTTLSVGASYASVSGGSSVVSANVSASATDAVKNDARLDIQASATIPSNLNSTITWTIAANNGGGFPAQGLLSAKTLLGASNNGIAIFLPVPSFAGTYLQLQAPPVIPVLSGASAGTIATVYYNVAPCSASPPLYWTLTYSASAECLAVYISNSSSTIANLLPSAPNQSAGVGSVTAAQITFSFITNQPGGTGYSNPNSVTLIASSAIGGNSWATGVVPITGQGIIPGLPSEIDAANAGLLNAIQANATSSNGVNPPGGASNQADSQGYAAVAFGLFNGPYGVPGATGWYPGAIGTASADTMHDFTAYGVLCTSNSGSGVNGSACTFGANITVVNTLQNTGAQPDTIQLTATPPAGWTVQLYNVDTCTGGVAMWPTCSQGAAITDVSGAGVAVSGTTPLAVNATLNYEAVYNATGNSALPFAAYTTKITAAGQSGAGTGTDTNDTYNTVYPGSVVLVKAAVAVPTTNCPTGIVPAAAGACPGGTLVYSLAYSNVVPANVASNSNLVGEPAFAYSALYSNVGSALLTDDGTLMPNNWATYSNGIAAAATDTTSGTIFTYYPSGSTTFAAGQTKVTAQIGGAMYQLAPGASGTVTFTVIVK